MKCSFPHELCSKVGATQPTELPVSITAGAHFASFHQLQKSIASNTISSQ